jgi:hypothetical protein
VFELGGVCSSCKKVQISLLLLLLQVVLAVALLLLQGTTRLVKNDCPIL